MKAIAAALSLLLAVCSMPAAADIDYKQYVQLEQMKTVGRAKHGFGALLLDHWLDGVASGLSWSQAAARAPGQKVFCLPERLALTAEVLRSVIRQFVDAHPHVIKDDTHMGAIALMAVKEAFPCGN